MNKPTLESSLERRACRKLKQLGAITRKMNGLGFRSWPDRLVLGHGFAFFIEFKRPGQKLTRLQIALHRDLVALGQKVYTCDSIELALEAWRIEDYQAKNRARMLEGPEGLGASRGCSKVLRTLEHYP